MKSKSGKVNWLCNVCHSGDILRCAWIQFPHFENFEVGERCHRYNHFYCQHCGNHDLWTNRLKISGKKECPELVENPVTYMGIYRDNYILHEGLGTYIAGELPEPILMVKSIAGVYLESTDINIIIDMAKVEDVTFIKHFAKRNVNDVTYFQVPYDMIEYTDVEFEISMQYGIELTTEYGNSDNIDSADNIIVSLLHDTMPIEPKPITIDPNFDGDELNKLL